MVFLEESEKDLQDYFINLLVNNGYEEVFIKNEDDLISNFKTQLKLFNKGINFNFDEVLNYLYSGDRNIKFDKLRKSFKGIKFIDFSDFSSNIFQVSQEITVVGDYSNRYDVTILINGLPLVQIELKRSGANLKNAFNQIQRYSNQSYSRLFDLIQIFIISNKVNTKYFFNDNNFNYGLTSNWHDLKDLNSFANSFLIKENLMKSLSDYIFNDSFSSNYLMLRDYQLCAIESVLDKIEDNENGYVWMSSNTGKSTTSLRLAELLTDKYQVIYITTNYLSEFPQNLIVRNNKEFLTAIDSQNLIITNIRSILAKTENLDEIKNDKFIFIFNEYEKHSQKYNPANLMSIFKNSLFYCFTSTPIFDENIIDGRTTKSIFSNQIFKYNFKDALHEKTSMILDCEYIDDEDISSEYDFSSDLRIKSISEYIVENIKSNSILIASSNSDVIKYYEYLRKTNLKVVPILRHDSNDIYESKPMRDYFEDYINEYNLRYDAGIQHRKVVDTSSISKDFELDVIKRFNNDEIELLIVDEAMLHDKFRVNLLGNLRKHSLNSLYLDCELNYEELFEVLMMVGEVDFNHKKCSNIKIFRDIRQNIQKTIKLYSNDSPGEEYILKDYNYYLNQYNQCLSNIDDDFVDSFKKLSEYYNILKSFEEFDFTKSQNDEFNYFKDKYDHYKYEIQSNKKIISKFDLKSIDKFSIDLKYIEKKESLGKTEDKQADKSINIFNQKNNNLTILNEITKNDLRFEENTNVLSLQKHDNSQNLSIVNNNPDLSKNINVKNEYHIHIGGDNIQKIDNLPSHLDLIENGEKQGKICPRCRKEYEERFNFCSAHEERINLVYIKDLTKKCNSCGLTYPENYNYCPNCGSREPLVPIYNTPKIIDIKTTPNKYYNFNNYPNRYGEIEDLLSKNNIEKIYNFNLSQMQFDNIINNIKSTHKLIFNSLINNYHIDFDSLSSLDKMILFSKSFVKTFYKEGGGDFGHFEFNEIYIDDRARDAMQITTIIHELSHFILAEILEQIVCELLSTEKTDAVEAFVCYNLAKDEFCSLVDEYCAHTVEGRFAVLGYQDYGSYKSVLTDFSRKYTDEHLEVTNQIGNTFAFYIKDIFSSFIDDELRENIKEEFTKINDVPKYSELKFETSVVLEWQKFSKAIQLMITSKINDLMENSYDIDRLKEYVVKFKKNNQG